MSPGSLTATERREATLASLAHTVLRPLPPDPELTFVVDLRPRRPIPRRTAP